jgi:hypothetical protein
MKSFFSQPNSFLAIILQLRIQCNSSAPKLISWQAGVPKLVSTRLDCYFSTEVFFITTLHGPRRKRNHYCWEGVFTASIIACVFVAAGMCLASCYVAVNLYSDFAISAFGRHVTLFLLFLTSHPNLEASSVVNMNTVLAHVLETALRGRSPHATSEGSFRTCVARFFAPCCTLKPQQLIPLGFYWSRGY